MPSIKTWRTVLGDGQAFVAGLPTGFDLHVAIRGAKKIRLATAFAQVRGWQHFSQAIKSGTGSVSLLSGGWLFFTAPDVLWEWHSMSLLDHRIEAKLASDATCFHPKVLVVEAGAGQRDFAIVGSGNLSEGGLRDNTECSLYTENAALIRELSDWFESQFDLALDLRPGVIRKYERAYETNRRRMKVIEKDQERVRREMVTADKAIIRGWASLVAEVKAYFRTVRFKEDYESRKEGARRILERLQYKNDFKFDRDGWNAFYKILELGRLRGHREQVFAKKKTLRKALQRLKAEGERAVPSVLDKNGELHIPGLGIATISKIMASHGRRTWPVYNQRVAARLREYGYESPRGAGPAEKYLVYRRAMHDLMEACAAEDMLALDAFVVFRRRAKQ
jgi:HKD family nuclease